MPGRVIVDMHMHVYPTREQGRSRKNAVQIVEYGEKPSVRQSPRQGDVTDALEEVRAAGTSHAVVLGLFYTRTLNGELVEVCPGTPAGTPVRHTRQSARDSLVAYNEWVCRLAAAHREFVPFICLDPWVMTPDDMTSHLNDMVQEAGARGVKLHPLAQRFSADDPRMRRVYRSCAELRVPVLAHSGTSDASAFADLKTYGHVLEAHPDLCLILAHLGGGAWKDTAEFARAYPSVLFDSSEIVAWVSAPKAPTRRELGELIHHLGASRVLLGSDFPWYDQRVTAEQILTLPVLAEEEKELVLGRNAAKLLQL